ncbi:AAA family ATPase [Clostridium butyricum]|uniref:AAA family ATPase n=2 Tax=Clostridium butyricum TaxID=1492 RepID=UPI0005C16899|nr:AAA family ATPase [Clostridium butyricum]KIU07791.1 hypothetical protein SC08_Contig83orf01714 [Clostridium butyricum]MBA8967623.1 putative ATPase [Clostridium butyricum]MBA8971310.1 putative ATPase [Clostridium butyricum]MBC2429373.1 AAA family ATPase [Clostridium butyricum]NOW36824.1 putative ATPase [Clostridium butyricum]
MILEYLYIKDYKKYTDTGIEIYKKSDNHFIEKIYNNIAFTVLVGENGAGKTTILSFIAHVFRYLQRDQYKIPSDFKMIYRIGEKNDIVVELEKKDSHIFITIKDVKYLLLEFDAKSKKYINNEKYKKTITYDDIMDYLPCNVIVSCFDVDYPSEYWWNYVGDRLLEINRVDKSYRKSAFGMDISIGIVKFLNKYFFSDEKIKKLFNSLGFKFIKCIYFFRNYSCIDENIIEELEDFYSEFGFCDWNEFLKKANFNSKDEFIDYILSDEYWKKYYGKVEEIEDEASQDEIIDFVKFAKDNFYNLELLYKLIYNNRIYINGFLLKKDDEILSIDKMSTGEKMLFFRLFFILAKIDDDSLIILEEPEIHLNYSLIKQLITIINLCFDEFNVHFLISSHNPVFINMLFPDNILVFEKNTINHPNINTFLANERELSRCLFGSSRMKNYIETEILEILKSNNVTLIEELMQNLGESYIKYLTFKRLKELGEINVEGN